MSPPSPHTAIGTGLPPPVAQPYGQYVLLRKLAEGGMAEIFLAKHLGTDGFERNVVIKRMLPHLSGLPDFVEMFRDEARLAARMVHPNIVQIHELGFAEGCYYICMEYLPGEDFSTTLRMAGHRRQYMPLHLVARVMADAARGLHYAHEMTDEEGKPLNIVHRDVSPSNVYLTYQGQMKVLDFGVAKAETQLARTRTGVVKGKYIYMAPEQAGGGVVDRRADVFSLGVSLYEAVTHIRPFARDNDLAVLNALLKGEFKRPGELRRDLPEALEGVILKAMALDPAQRYPTAAAFADDLERFIINYPAPANAEALAGWLRVIFGEERFVQKTRIPTLATVAGGLEARQSATGIPVVNSEARTGMVLPPPGTRSGPLARWRNPLVGMVAGGVVLAALAFFVGRALAHRQATPAAPVAPAPVAAAPAQVAPPPQPVAPAVALAPATGTAAPAATGTGGEAVPAGTQATPSTAPTPATESKPAPPKPRLATLLPADIVRVVARNQAKLVACFDKHKSDLPTDTGKVRVHLTVAGSGRAKAEPQGPLATTSVGRCLEEQLERMRFPAHRDEDVEVELPLNWKVSR